LSTKVTPVGRAPLVTEIVGTDGNPWAVVTVKVAAVPTVKVAEAAEVMALFSSTVRANACDAAVPNPLEAISVIG
jgi:hypothetical protein